MLEPEPPSRPERPRSASKSTERPALPPARPEAGVPGEENRVEPLALPNLGEKIDEFRLVESIGAGGMGAVFRAIDLGLDRQVALKILPPEQAVDPEVVRRYHQEGRAAARLDHENIARVYTIGDDGRYHYIVFEYIEGVTIRQRVIRDGPLPIADAVHLTLQIAQALIHAAEREVVHRDIKPSNIIVTPSGRAKLVDMGLARQFERGGQADLTQTGMTLGTFDYISPEQARDPRDVDIRGDLYSLGCTLFHMLSGRPPFPEGTVLQKLIQHREEAPPDIRRLNPRVPDSLASILGRLLVKDRDHRYQTPEQLAHDLRKVATRRTIALASSRATPNWARHLFWGGPGLAFLIVLGVLAWWGDGPPSGRLPLGGLGGVPGLDALPSFPVAGPAPAPVPAAAGLTRPAAESAGPREVAVGPADDLARVLAEIPPRSTVILIARGPYELRVDRPIRLDRADLTIRAEAGVRPLIRFAAGPAPLAGIGRGNAAPAGLIEVRGGRLNLEGLDFMVDPLGFEAALGAERPSAGAGLRVLAAVVAEDADVTIRRCSFRRPGGAAAGPGPAPGWRAAAIRLRGSARAARGGEAVTWLQVDASEFEGHQVALLASGPVDVSLRDVSFGPTPADGASLWAENAAGASVPAEFRLDHVGAALGAGPLFRFVGTAPRVIARHSAIGPIPHAGVAATAPPATLVAIDHPDRLDWRGGDNLYARVTAYLRPVGPRADPPVRAFATWADDPATFRESGSEASEADLWEALPAAGAAPNPAESLRSFRLVLHRPGAHPPGSRSGPTGPLPAPIRLAVAGGRNWTTPPDLPSAVGAGAVAPAMAVAANAAGRRLPGGAEPRADGDENFPDGLTPMPTTDPARTAIDPPALTRADPASAVGPSPVRTTAQFLDALRRDEPGARALVLAADADLDLPSGRLAGSAPWTIRAERGTTRPRLRFRADSPESVETAGWAAWMTLRSAPLRLEGVDLVLPAGVAGASRFRAAFAVRPGGGELTLDNCTVTIEGDGARSAVVAVLPAADPVAANPFDHLFPAPRRRDSAGAEAQVRFSNSLLRSAGDLVDVAAGRSVALDLDNTVVATAGVLVHGHGREEGRPAGALRVGFRRLAARLAGGLVHLETDRDRPSLPVASIRASDAILAVAHLETPLIRVDGQGDLAALRDRVSWQGQSVAYHRIGTYRRDETSRPGVLPVQVDRDSWEASIRPGRDEGAIRGDLQFRDEASLAAPAWAIRADDLRLRPESPAADAAIGPDLLHVPDPPPPRATGS